MKKIVGFNLIYPEGCKEITEGLKSDELRRRMTDLIRILEDTQIDKPFSTDSLLNNTDANISVKEELKMEGLLLHLTSEMFIDHEEGDIQLRVAVCICNILKLYCPTNPFLAFSDSRTRLKTVLDFLLKCLNEMGKLKSKSDKNFLNLYKIFSISCETHLFHSFTLADDGESLFIEYVRTMYNIVRKFPDWSDDNKSFQTLSDAMIVLFSSHEISVPDKVVSYMLNFLADRAATKEQRQLSLDIIGRCLTKLEDQIQTIIRNYLIKSEIDDDLSDSSENEESNGEDDDFCSMPEFRIASKKQEQKLEKSKPKPQKLEKNKNTIETCIEYSCDHTFQLVYELFKISAAIVIPLLSTIEMKLRSPNNVTDRKRACRLLGKLFISYIPSNNSNHSSLWECFLGRFCDIEVDVREICVRVARDVLRRAITGDDISGILSIPTSKEDLVRALQKRSHDQEESIRFQLVLSISQIFEKSKSIIVDEELDFVNETLFKILVDRTRDKCMVVRKEANASLGKLYRRILSESETRVGECNKNVDMILDLGNLLPGQRTRLELLLTQILRLYLRTEVEDKIVVERLFNTFLVPYNFDSGNRMKALLQCFILCDEASLMSIQELFKTQVIIMNLLRETVNLIKDSNADKVLSPSVSQKLKDKVKRLGEYLPNKDKIESLSKFFVSIRTDKRLMETVSKLVNPDSSRDVIVKSIPEIKKHFSTTKPGSDPNPANIQKKKVLVNTIKCLLERSAPIIMDISSGQELISLMVSSKETLESLVQNEEYTAYICRALKLLHCISIIYRNSVPTLEAYEYIASIISRFDSNKSDSHIETSHSEIIDDKQLTPSSTRSIASVISTQSTFKELPKSVEELCLLTLARIIDCRPSSESSIDSEEDKFSAFHDQTKTLGLFAEEAEPLLAQTMQVVDYLMNCATIGSTYPMLFASAQFPSKTKNKDNKNLPIQSDEGDREICLWKYNCRIAKLATRCLIGLYVCCQQELRLKSSDHKSEILEMLENKLEDLVKSANLCEVFSANQSIRLSTLSQLGLKLRQRYGTDIHSYVQNTVLMRILTSDESDSTTELTEPRNLSCWGSNNSISIKTQVIIQALKMLSKWMVTLKVDDDRNLILTVMISLRKYIGSNSNPNFNGNLMDGDMAQIRLAAGKCWLKLAQVQSFLSIFDVKWLHRLSELIYDPCSYVREGFLRKLHKGLFRLQLPLDYMAMFAFVPFIHSPEYSTLAKNFFAANVTRRREFLERNPQYQTDAKLLFAVLPEYVLAFIIHMLAHDKHWLDVDDQASIFRVKQCLWFVMEPILKMNENSSFIRKLLEKIKHAQDATDPNNSIINEKLYICCDISLGLLISKQASYDLKEYPVELKLPRTRYLPAPNTFFNPDFANILIGDDPPKVRVQFSPTHKSKQMMMNFMPAPLIKGHTINPAINNNNKAPEETDVQIQKPIPSSKPKKHIAKIVVGLPEIESEAVSSPPSSSSNVKEPITKKQLNVRKMPIKRKSQRPESPIEEVEELETNPMMSVTKRGRICKPNVRVMKDMVSLSKKSTPAASTPTTNETNELSDSTVRIEGTVSINLERMQTYDYTSDNFDEEETSFAKLKKGEIVNGNEDKSPKVQKSITTKPIESPSILSSSKSKNRRPSILKKSIGNNNSQNSTKSFSVSEEKIDESENVKIIPSKRATIVRKPTKKVVIVHSPEILENKIEIFQDKTIDRKKNSPSSNRKSKDSKDKSNVKLIRETRNSPSISSQSSVVRLTRSSQEKTPPKSSDSVTLNRLTKEILTRKASSIRIGTVKDVSVNTLKNINSKSKSSAIVLDMEKSRKKVTRKNSVLDDVVASNSNNKNNSPLSSPTRKTPVKAKKSIESSPKTPITIVSRSKRVASQAATDSLIKKTKVM